MLADTFHQDHPAPDTSEPAVAVRERIVLALIDAHTKAGYTIAEGNAECFARCADILAPFVLRGEVPASEAKPIVSLPDGTMQCMACENVAPVVGSVFQGVEYAPSAKADVPVYVAGTLKIERSS